MAVMQTRGEFLIKTPITGKMELALFRNDEEDFDVFEIQILLSPATPQRSCIFNLNQVHCDWDSAYQAFQKMLKELRTAIKD